MLHRFRKDPAVSPGAFATAVADGVGYGSVLGIATV
jgi:Mg/Co/Ni transporter MgtE